VEKATGIFERENELAACSKKLVKKAFNGEKEFLHHLKK